MRAVRSPPDATRPFFNYEPRDESALAARDQARPSALLAGAAVLALVCCWLTISAVRRRFGAQTAPPRRKRRAGRKTSGRNGATKSGWGL